MGSTGEEPMLVDRKAPKGRTVPPDLLCGVFLKCVGFLNRDCSTFTVVGIFQNRGNRAGLVVKSARAYVYLDFNRFHEFYVRFSDVTGALEGRGSYRVVIPGGADILIKTVFGKRYVFIYDGERTLSLLPSEWVHFTDSLSCLTGHFRELFLCEDLLRQYIVDVLAGDGEFVTPPVGLPPYFCDRLFDEVQYYRRHGGSG